MDRSPACPVFASTVVLLRPSPAGPEVLLVRRHGASGFMGGATVFPGGKVDPADVAADREEGDGGRLAALRELHEESRVLLARTASGTPVAPADAEEFAARVERARVGRRLPAGAWHAELAARAWVAAADELFHFARWVTPDFEPRRFDTAFFAALAPDGQVAAFDGHETTHAHWARPCDAVAEHLAGGEVLLPPPTLDTLHRLADAAASRGLADAASIRALLRDWAAGGPPRPIDPVLVTDDPDGPCLVLPGDPRHPRADGAGFALRRFRLRADGRFERRVLARQPGGQ